MDGPARWRILRLHVEDGIPLSALARETGISLRTLERWHARYRADGYAGLETGQRSDAGAHHLPRELVRLIEGLALSKPRPAIATIHRKVTDICGTRGWPVPSYGVVRSIAGALDPGMVTLALEGAASYRDKHELVLRRHAEQPNAMWQSDHTLLDILVVGTDGKPVRPWLTTILDDCSRAICGYTVFLGAPSAMNTALALRQAIWHKSDPAWPMCGLPDVLYVDHGSDFISRHLAGTAMPPTGGSLARRRGPRRLAAPWPDPASAAPDPPLHLAGTPLRRTSPATGDPCLQAALRWQSRWPSSSHTAP